MNEHGSAPRISGPFAPVGAVVGTVKAVILPLNRAHWGLSAPEVFSQVK